MRPGGRATRTTGDGQVTLEVALAMIGVVMFLYVTLKSWVWLTAIIVNRQEAYNASRLEAGTARGAGRPVRYTPTPLRLVAEPTGRQGGPGGWTPGEPPCRDADALYEQADRLSQLGRDLLKEVEDTDKPRIEGIADDMEWTAKRLEREDDDDDREDLRRELERLRVQLEAEQVAMDDKLEQARELFDEAQALVDQGDALCED